MDNVVLPSSWARTLLILLGCLGFVGLSVWIMSLPAHEVSLKVTIAAWVGIPFFGLIGIFALYRLFSNNPALIIDVNGITDNASALSAGFIPWSNFASAAIITIKNQRMIRIDLVNVNGFLTSLGPFKRRVLKMNLAMVGYAVAIPGVSFAMPIEEVLSHINRYYQLYRSTTHA